MYSHNNASSPSVSNVEFKTLYSTASSSSALHTPHKLTKLFKSEDHPKKKKQLSSSNSNSLISHEPSNKLNYNFHPINVDSPTQITSKGWSYLYSKVMEFCCKGELDISIEECNRILEQSLVTSSISITTADVSDLISQSFTKLYESLSVVHGVPKIGQFYLNSLYIHNSEDGFATEKKLVLFWDFFLHKLFHILQGILLPLQIKHAVSLDSILITGFTDHIFLKLYRDEAAHFEKSESLEHDIQLMLLQCLNVLHRSKDGEDHYFDQVVQFIKLKLGEDAEYPGT